jgi:hypothetical protein
MLGLMQNWPLLCHRIIEHAAAIHGKQGGGHAVRRRTCRPHHLQADS